MPANYQQHFQQENSQPVSPKPQGQNTDMGYTSLHPPLVTRATAPQLKPQLSEDQYVLMNKGNSPSPSNDYEDPRPRR